MPPRILLADDSVTVQKVIELTFSDEGMQVIAVGDGQQAIERLSAERPDIVLADVSMPERDGYAVAEHVKTTPELKHIPVVLMTGAFEQLDEARARAVGCDGVLAKPFEPQMVISIVRELLARPAGASEVAAEPASTAADEPTAEAAVQRPATLDEYFDRIDEALAPAEMRKPMPEVDPDADTLIAIPAYQAPAQEATPAADASAEGTASSPPASGASPLATAFSALLADELGESPLPASWAGLAAAPAAPATPPAVESAAAAEPAPITEAFVDEVARRVAERLSQSMVREVVNERVIDVTERLVREEIDRLKAHA